MAGIFGCAMWGSGDTADETLSGGDEEVVSAPGPAASKSNKSWTAREHHMMLDQIKIEGAQNWNKVSHKWKGLVGRIYGANSDRSVDAFKKQYASLFAEAKKAFSWYSKTPGARLWKDCVDDAAKTLYMDAVFVYICVNRASFKAGWFNRDVLIKLMSFIEASNTGVTDAAELTVQANVEKNKWAAEREHKKDVMKRKMEEAESEKELERETKRRMLENDAIRTKQLGTIVTSMDIFAAAFSAPTPLAGCERCTIFTAA